MSQVQNPIRALLKQFRKELIAVGLFSMVANVLMLTPTIYMLQVFDRVMVSQSGLTLITVSVLVLLLFLVMGFAEWLRSRVLVRAGVRIDKLLNTKVFEASYNSALSQSGKPLAEGFTDLTNLRQFMTGNGIFAFFDAPWTPIYIAVAWLLHPILGYVALVFVVILSLLGVLGHFVTKQSHQLTLQNNLNTNAFVQSKLRNAESVEAMGMVANLRSKWLKLHAQDTSVAQSTHDKTSKLQALTKFVQYSQQSLILGAGAVLVIWGEISVGAMIAANILMARALQPVQMVVGSWKGFMAAKLSYQRLSQLLIEFEPKHSQPLSFMPSGRLETRGLNALSFDGEKHILRDVSLSVNPGEVLVVVGPSGSGKSTLAKCLLGIWPRTTGLTLLDGTEINLLDREALGPHIGYLPQEIELFEGTIAENICRFGEIDSEKIIWAARTAGVHEMILRFPNGYETPMGVAGGVLSGGQRQRIALARALYGSPQILVLDEPNANLDDLGERALVQAIGELKQLGKTVVIVSHRQGIVQIADALLVMQGGQVRFYGPQPQVLAELSMASAAAAA